MATESFAAGVAALEDDTIEVVLARSGKALKVAPNETILDAVLRSGVETFYDCKAGECGTCVVNVIEGEPLHRDVYLNTSERAAGKQMCICVSRAKTKRLVLDL